jgi:phosphoglucosamine mutase
MLKELGGVLGGETSGHLLCLDRTTTGDGLISALEVLAVMKRTGRPLAELAAGMPKFPQVMINVRVRDRVDPSRSPSILAAVKRVEEALAGTGRVVLRASGTEPVIRVMVEAREQATATRFAEQLAEAVRTAA